MENSEKIIKLKSSDDKIFQISIAACKKSETIVNVIETLGIDVPVSLPMVSSEILKMIICFLEYHKNDKDISTTDLHESKEIDEWDQHFLRVDEKTLFDLSMAADYMNINLLIDICMQKIANILRGKSTVEMRQILGITSDLTDEQEQQIRRENAWCDV